MLKKVVLLLAISGLLLFGANHPVSANNDARQKASSAIKAKDYKSAYKYLKPLADAGDNKARLQVGLILRRGFGGVSVDEAQAFKYLLKAAQQKQWNSQYIVAAMYADGAGVAQDDVAALKWAGIAAGRGSKTGRELAIKLRDRMSARDIQLANAEIDNWSKATLIDGRSPENYDEECSVVKVQINELKNFVTSIKSKEDLDDLRSTKGLWSWPSMSMIYPNGKVAFADGETRYNGLIAILKSNPDC